MGFAATAPANTTPVEASKDQETKAQTAAAAAPEKTAIEATPEQPPVQLTPKELLEQCGIENDENEYEDYEPLPRIKTSQLNSKLQEEFQKNLDEIFSNDTLIGKRIRFEPNRILNVINEVKPILMSEPMLIDDVPFGVTIVADLHGQLHDLHRVFMADSKDGKPGWLCTKYLFLGDYVDRGRQSLEVLMALFSLKALYPDRIFLLRGNHEFGAANQRYGFPTECSDRYTPEALAEFIYYKWNELFCVLSAAAIVGNKYFCAHGGVSTSGMTRRQLKRIPKPYINSNEDLVIHDLVWADPARGLKGASFNGERHSSIYYGLDVLAHALASVECICLFRGHTVLDKGYEMVANMCIALFSCTGPTNDAAVALIAEDGKCLMRTLKTDLERVKWEVILKKIDGRIEIDDDNDVTTFGEVEEGQTGKLKEFD